MAKRRKLEAPSAEDLNRIEAEFRDETSAPRGRGVAPIASVMAETAGDTQVETAAERAARAKAETEAGLYRNAQGKGLLIVEIPTDQIDANAMVRDRTVMDEDDQAELRASIGAGGLRLPVEVFELGQEGPHRYGLLSGFRRLKAVRELAEMTQGASSFDTIKAIIRPRTEADQAFVQMVEENEVRADLSNYERGRIAVISAKQGAFADTQDAVNRLFASGSKAKRSKIRSYALIFEELGDMLTFPEALTETRGLQLSTALRGGLEPDLRQALSARVPQDAEEEWEMLAAVLAASKPAPKDRARGGRPRTKPVAGWIDDVTIQTSTGYTIRRGEDSHGTILRFEGRRLDRAMMESLMLEIQRLLEA
ncbi:MAG: ParB N-terminal domain-containing protein [Pseudomonadota bacterium]|nr:ParB N-terminal domain-containing protein [Pseudomonadota bacterium]